MSNNISEAAVLKIKENSFSAVSNIMLFVFGWFVFFPIELVYDGLWFSYALIIVIIPFVGLKNSRVIMFFLIYATLVCLSTLFGDFQSLTSIVNPILTALLLTVARIDINRIEIILSGIYAAAVSCVFYMFYLASQLDILSLFILLTSREWGVGKVYGFGNGLAIIFAFSMFFAYKQSKYLLMCTLFVGGVFTTSRVPFVVLSIILASLIFNASRLRKSNLIYLFTVVFLFFLSIWMMSSLQDSQIDILQARLSTAEDRVDVYNLAWDSFLNNPILGIGAEKLTDFEHAHNSYLQVLSKYGLIGFCSWIALWYHAILKNLNIFKNLDFVLLLLVISTFQIGLHNPNAMLLVVLYNSRFVISRDHFLSRGKLNV